MFFRRQTTFFTIFLALLLAAPVFANKMTTGKVRSVLGDVTRQKAQKTNWTALRVGAKVEESDKIKTASESQAIINLPDGSSISVEENALVVFSELLAMNGSQHLTAEVIYGKIRFDVQKQSNKDNTFSFRTGTAAAAVRGTAGIIGQTSRGKPIAALSEGKLEITIGSKISSISGGETAIPDGDSLVVLQLASSGDLNFLNQIDSLLSDTTKTLNDLKEQIRKLDSINVAKQKAQIDSLDCSFEAIPDTINTSYITIKGNCKPGIFVQVGAERIEVSDETFQFTPSWDSETYGPKKFPISCYVGKISLPCGYITTNYSKPVVKEAKKAEPRQFKVFTQSPIKVCDVGAVSIEGTFDPIEEDATLFVKLGSYTSPNLVPMTPSGNFKHTIAISDRIGNWEEKKATVEFHSKTSNKTVNLDLDIDKNCAAINQKNPILHLQRYDSTACKASLSLSNTRGDITLLTTKVDGDKTKETSYTMDAFTTFNLTTGTHKYTFTATDRAGNKAEIVKTMSCYPKNRVFISIKGGNTEQVRIPKIAKKNNHKISTSFSFKLNNVPQADPAQIKKITVKQNGQKIFLLKESQINDTKFDIPIELMREKKTIIIKVEVVMKNGSILNASKIYEVR